MHRPTLRSRLGSMKQELITARGSHGKSPTGIPLPPLSFRMGGDHFRNDESFIASAHAEVDRLSRLVNLSEQSRILDWGCGAGRLAIGIADRFGRADRYSGVDVQRHLINWARWHLGKIESFEFSFVDIKNERYNPDGQSPNAIPGNSGYYDIFYAYSVFSHLDSDDSQLYLKEVGRLLQASGRAVFTAFVEDDVPDQEVNPANYGPIKWSGALHCVRYNRELFESYIQDAGLQLESFTYGKETDGQSLYVLSKL